MDKRINTILLSTILLLMIAGPIIYFFVLKDNPENENHEKSIKTILATSVDFNEITTNLGTGEIIRVSIKIETNEKKAKEELEKRDFQIKNVIIKHLSSLSSKDLASSDGKAKLESDLKDKFNEVLTNGTVEKVYITSFIVQ